MHIITRKKINYIQCKNCICYPLIVWGGGVMNRFLTLYYRPLLIKTIQCERLKRVCRISGQVPMLAHQTADGPSNANSQARLLPMANVMIKSDRDHLTPASTEEKIIDASERLLELGTSATEVQIRRVLMDPIIEQNINPQHTLKSLAAKKAPQLIFAVLEVLRREGHPDLDAHDYSVGISSCCRFHLWQHACRLFESMPDASLRQNVFTFTAVTSSFAKGTRWQSACSLFALMSISAVKKNHISFSTNIMSCEGGKQWRHALNLFQNLCDVDIPHCAFSFNAVISSCGAQWAHALELLGAMRRVTQLDVICLCAAMSSCEQAGLWQHALSLFHAISESSVKPDVISFNVAISACEKGMQWQEALSLIAAMPESQLQADCVSFNAAIASCQKGGQWQKALILFAAMSDAILLPDIISFNTTISACESWGQWQHALNILSLMLDVVLYPDVISFSSAMSACEKDKRWQQALELFRDMSRASVLPNVFSFSAIISACQKGEQWQTALNIFEIMPQIEVRPNSYSLNAAVTCCERRDRPAGCYQFLSGPPLMKTETNAAVKKVSKSRLSSLGRSRSDWSKIRPIESGRAHCFRVYWILGHHGDQHSLGHRWVSIRKGFSLCSRLSSNMLNVKPGAATALPLTYEHP